MKTRLGLQATLVMFLIAAVTTAQAQRRGHDHNQHDNNRGGQGNGYGHGNHDRDYDRNRHDYRDHYDRHDRRDVVVYHHYCPAPAPRVVNHYYYDRPRYVYYRDYDVYYDCHRQVFISFSGRNWTVSVNRPVCMDRVDIYRAAQVNVNYYDDDFPVYLDQQRPHGRVYAEW